MVTSAVSRSLAGARDTTALMPKKVGAAAVSLAGKPDDERAHRRPWNLIDGEAWLPGMEIAVQGGPQVAVELGVATKTVDSLFFRLADRWVAVGEKKRSASRSCWNWFEPGELRPISPHHSA
jgi:hypothetical protein